MSDELTLKRLKRRGACRTADVRLFFPQYDSPSANKAAIEICEGCSVRADCLEWALDNDEEGVWGGTGEADRRSLLRKRSRIHCIICRSENIIDDHAGHEICVSCGASWPV